MTILVNNASPDLALARGTYASAQAAHGALHDLDWMHFNGDGVTKDYTEAMRWFRITAEPGEADAQFSA